MYISPSSISAFLSCRKKWAYGRVYHESSVTPAFFLGSAVHFALEHFYRSGANPLDSLHLWAAREFARLEEAGVVGLDRTKLLEQITLGGKMLEGYLRFYGETPEADQSIRVLSTEIEFKVPIPGTTDGFLVGKMDGILRDTDGWLWVLESKTYSSLPKQHNLNLQTLAYTWAANEMATSNDPTFRDVGIASGERVYGSLYNGLRKQAPSDRVIKDLFVREWVMRNSHELRSFARILRDVHETMAAPDVRIFPTMTQECSWCTFNSPCMAGMVGADERWILENTFRRKKPDTAKAEEGITNE